MKKLIDLLFCVAISVLVGSTVYNYLDKNVTPEVNKINEITKIQVAGKSF